MRPTHYQRYVVFKHFAVEAPRWCCTRREAMDVAVELHRKNGGRYFVTRVIAFTDVVVKENAV